MLNITSSDELSIKRLVLKNVLQITYSQNIDYHMRTVRVQVQLMLFYWFSGFVRLFLTFCNFFMSYTFYKNYALLHNLLLQMFKQSRFKNCVGSHEITLLNPKKSLTGA